MLDAESAKVLNNLVQASAVAVAGLYFLFRWSRGWIYSNLSLSSKVLRQPKFGSSRIDDVIVTIGLQKGDRASAKLEEIYVQPVQLSGDSISIERQSIDIGAPSKSRNLNLPPGETAKFDVHFEIPRSSVVRFDTIVISKTASWRTSTISLPSRTNDG